MPDHDDFGVDLPEHYGTLTYYDEYNVYHEEKVISEVVIMEGFMMIYMKLLFMVKRKQLLMNKLYYKWKY